MRSLRTCCALCVAAQTLLLATPARAAEPPTDRTTAAASHWEAIIKRQRRLKEGEFFLVTFKASHRPSVDELVKLVDGSDARFTAIHLKGDRADGVFAFFLDERRPLRPQLLEVMARLPTARREVSENVARVQGASPASTPPLQAGPSHPVERFCALEVHGSLQEVERLSRSMASSILSIEIVSNKIRLFPKCE